MTTIIQYIPRAHYMQLRIAALHFNFQMQNLEKFSFDCI